MTGAIKKISTSPTARKPHFTMISAAVVTSSSCSSSSPPPRTHAILAGQSTASTKLYMFYTTSMRAPSGSCKRHVVTRPAIRADRKWRRIGKGACSDYGCYSASYGCWAWRIRVLPHSARSRALPGKGPLLREVCILFRGSMALADTASHSGGSLAPLAYLGDAYSLGPAGLCGQRGRTPSPPTYL